MNFEDMLKQLETLVPTKNVKIQPETARLELLKFEKNYTINTVDFLNQKHPTNHIPDEVKDIWFDVYGTFLNFGGSDEQINHLSQLDPLLKSSYIQSNEPIKEAYLSEHTEQATDAHEFVACFFMIISYLRHPNYLF